MLWLDAATRRCWYNMLKHTGTYCNILQHIATHCNTRFDALVGCCPTSLLVCLMQHTATRCNVCNTLQNTATHCNTLQHKLHAVSHRCCWILDRNTTLELWCVPPTLRSNSLCCCVLQYVQQLICSLLQSVAVCCSLLQHIQQLICRETVCCSMSQCVAVCCSVMQCAALCCSMHGNKSAHCPTSLPLLLNIHVHIHTCI